MFDQDVFYFEDYKTKQDPFYEYEVNKKREGTGNNIHNSAIVIDNGSYQCRAGFDSSEKPQLIFRNAVAKQRGKKQENEIQVGNDIANIEAVRSSMRSQFDRNIVTQYDIQEKIFDYIFSHMGINSDGAVNHPIVLTEAPLNPLHCKHNMTELLFECYHVPALTLGCDALFSLYKNSPVPSDALVLSLGHQTMHVLAVGAGGSLDAPRSRRVNLGGSQLEAFLHRSLQLKYPEHLIAMTPSRAEDIVHHHCHVSTDYLTELSRWSDVPYYNRHVHRLQLLFTKAASVVQSAEQIKEKREMQARRLREMNHKRREEKLRVQCEQLQKLLLARDLLEDGEHVSLVDLGYSTRDELVSQIDDTQDAVNKLKLALNPEDSGNGALDPADDPHTKQKMSKDSRGKVKQKEVTESEDMERWREEDFDGWLEEMRLRKQTILNKRAERKKHRQDMSKRKTLASQQRMQKLTKLAAGDKKQSKKPDTFGLKDSDWDIYKEINRECGDSDSDSDGDNLTEIDTLLSLYDPQGWSGNDGDDSEMDAAERYQIHIAVEQIRVPELMFQPSITGDTQAGLGEAIEYVLKKFSPLEQQRLVQFVFLTGGLAMLPNLVERVEKELMEMRPFQSTFSLRTAADPVLDPWHGARLWSLSGSPAALTRAEYLEQGLDYVRDHPTRGTLFMPSSLHLP